MKRYLVCFSLNKTYVTLQAKVFSLTNSAGPDDVTVPLNTIFFHFVQSEANSAKELEESYIAVSIGNKCQVNPSIKTIIKKSKIYFIGKLEDFYGESYIVNHIIGTKIPIRFFDADMSYEVIDL